MFFLFFFLLPCFLVNKDYHKCTFPNGDKVTNVKYVQKIKINVKTRFSSKIKTSWDNYVFVFKSAACVHDQEKYCEAA